MQDLQEREQVWLREHADAYEAAIAAAAAATAEGGEAQQAAAGTAVGREGVEEG